MTEVEYYTDYIGRLLASRDYEWCRDTLEGICVTINRTQRVTPNQKQAIDHLVVGRLKHDVR